MIESVLMWAMFACAVAYALEMPWRLWQNRMPKRWAPIWGDIFLPVAYVLMAVSRPNAVKVLAAVFLCAGSLHRYFVRRRLGVPAFPPV
jgi:hypothetical protein